MSDYKPTDIGTSGDSAPFELWPKDLIAFLRSPALCSFFCDCNEELTDGRVPCPVCSRLRDAADEIEALREERTRYFDSACKWAEERDELRALITAWADAEEADHAALGMEMGTHQSCECTPWCALRKAVGR